MLGELKAHKAKLFKMAINSEETLLASSSEDSIVNLWNLKTDALVHTFKNSYGFEVSELCLLRWIGKTNFMVG